MLWLRRAVGAGFVFGVLALAVGAHPAVAQGLTYSSGQSVSPSFEGWGSNPDGSFNLMFGYMNRNWGERPDVPVGDDNMFSPGLADRGNPPTFCLAAIGSYLWFEYLRTSGSRSWLGRSESTVWKKWPTAP